MNRLTLGTLREPIARVLNVCTTDSTIPGYVNEAERRLVAKGKWLGTVGRYRICTTSDGCLSWPRFIESIEGYWLCNTPGTVRNGWFEDNPQGPGLQSSNGTSCATMLVDRGTLPTYDTIVGTISKLAVRADVTEASDSRTLWRGFNQLGEWIRTFDNGAWIDGEYILNSTVTQYSVNFFASVVQVVKPRTNGTLRAWQYTPSTATLDRQIAIYEPDEELPIYRVSLIPGLSQYHGSGNASGGCSCASSTSNQLTVIAKLRHLDVINDNDFLLLGNLGAIKLMVMAILKEERNLFDESVAYEAKAIKELEAELSSYEGDGAIPTIKSEGSRSWGAGVVNALQVGYPVTW